MSDNTTTSGIGGNTMLQKAAAAVGAVFLLVGILGFVPGITTHVGDMAFAGNDQLDTKLLGLFSVSVFHNIVHLLFGVGLLMSRTWSGARTYLIGGGVLYLVLFLYGLVVPVKSEGNFVPFNNTDDWLHLVLGLGMVALGFLLSKDRVDDRTGPAYT